MFAEEDSAAENWFKELRTDASGDGDIEAVILSKEGIGAINVILASQEAKKHKDDKKDYRYKLNT